MRLPVQIVAVIGSRQALFPACLDAINDLQTDTPVSTDSEGELLQLVLDDLHLTAFESVWTRLQLMQQK
jgi:hypothetical protein